MRLDILAIRVKEAVSCPGTGPGATHPPLLPRQRLLLNGSKRVSAPNNRHSLRGLAQANSMCSPNGRDTPRCGALCLGAPHRIFMSNVLAAVKVGIDSNTENELVCVCDSQTQVDRSAVESPRSHCDGTASCDPGREASRPSRSRWNGGNPRFG